MALTTACSRPRWRAAADAGRYVSTMNNTVLAIGSVETRNQAHVRNAPAESGSVRFKGACIDLDGTLIDTETLHLAAEADSLLEFGVNPNDGRRPRTFGLGLPAGMEVLAKAFSIDREALFMCYAVRWETAVTTELTMLPGARDLLCWLAAHRIPVALVTSGDATYYRLVDATLALEQYFTAIVTADAVSQTKPSPEPYLVATSRLGIEPEWCVGFEDSGAGIAALNAAGLHSVAVHREQSSRSELRPARMSLSGLDKAIAYLPIWFG